MLTTYKGFYWLKQFKENLYTGKTKYYFYTPIKKLFKNWYLIKIYKKKTQWYNYKAIKYLSKYVDIQIYEQNDDYTLTVRTLNYLKKCNHSLLIRCHSKQDNSYISCPENTLKLINKNFIEFYTSDKEELANVYKHKNGDWYYKYNNKLLKLNSIGLYNIEHVIQYLKDKYEKNKPERGYIADIYKKINDQEVNNFNKIKEQFRNKKDGI